LSQFLPIASLSKNCAKPLRGAKIQVKQMLDAPFGVKNKKENSTKTKQ
jgi:hypothetical protein